MADLANRTTMKTELAQTVSKAYIPSQEADTATLRKAGVGDYRVAIDDRLLKQESDDTQALLQAEFDETQVKIQQNTEAEWETVQPFLCLIWLHLTPKKSHSIFGISCNIFSARLSKGISVSV